MSKSPEIDCNCNNSIDERINQVTVQIKCLDCGSIISECTVCGNQKEGKKHPCPNGHGEGN